jgi:hypothetical protein
MVHVLKTMWTVGLRAMGLRAKPSRTTIRSVPEPVRQPVLNAPPVKAVVTVYYGDGRAEDYEIRLQSISMSTNAWGPGSRMTVEGDVINVRGRGDEPLFTSNGTNPKAWIPAAQPDRLYVSPAVYEAYQKALDPPRLPEKPKEPPATAADLLKVLGR